MLVELVLYYINKTKRMKSRLTFSIDCNLNEFNFVVLPYIVNRVSNSKTLVSGEKNDSKSSKSDNHKQSYVNLKSVAFEN